MSPLQFHNSVHNAPAGYWGIATGSRHPSVSLGADRGSFAAALIEAACTARSEHRPTVLSVYDIVAPKPLVYAYPLVAPFGVGLVLGNDAKQEGRRRIGLTLVPTPPSSPSAAETRMQCTELERLRSGNPAARALPLLAAFAENRTCSIVLEYLDDCHLRVEHLAS